MAHEFLKQLMVGTALVAATSYSSVYAQTADDESTANSRVLGAVTVTTQKREESVQSVPITINAYSGADLVKSGVENTLDLQVKEPSLVFTTNAAFGQPYLRGVGSDLFTPGAESSIATFVDDVYQSRTVSALQDFYDIERVDVVKGPQGVLFGRNAVGGAINVNTAKPTDEFEGYLSGTLGNYNKVRIEGALNIPLAEDKAAWRIAGLISERDGYTDNVFTGGDLDDEGLFAMRTHLDLALTPNFDLLLSGYYSSEDSSRSMAARVDTDFGLAIADGFGATRPDDPYEVALNEDSFVEIETTGLSATADWDLGDVALKSITSYRETDASMRLDLDASELDYASNSPMQQSETWSQEFQLVSQNGGQFDWVLGAFALTEDATQFLDVNLNFPAITGAPSDLRDQPGGTVETTSYGLFGNAKWKLSDTWALNTGVRYNYDERSLDFLETVSALSDGTIFAQIPLQLEDDYSEWTPRAVLEYTPSDDLLVYGSVSRGYKAGGFNTNIFQPEGFEPETLWAYEAGIKSTFNDGRARVNSAVFHYAYEDLQLNTIPPGSPAGTFQIVINAAEATITGWEGDASFIVTDDFVVNAGFQLLDAEFEDFIALNANDAASGELDRSGSRLPRAPETSLNLGAEYTWQVHNRDMTLRGDYRYESEQFLDIFADDAVARDSNSIINARLSYDVGDNVNLALWGRNLTDEDVVQSSLRVDGLFGTIQFYSPPRTYGATLRLDF